MHDEKMEYPNEKSRQVHWRDFFQATARLELVRTIQVEAAA